MFTTRVSGSGARKLLCVLGARVQLGRTVEVYVLHGKLSGTRRNAGYRGHRDVRREHSRYRDRESGQPFAAAGVSYAPPSLAAAVAARRYDGDRRW